MFESENIEFSWVDALLEFDCYSSHIFEGSCKIYHSRNVDVKSREFLLKKEKITFLELIV